MTKSQIEKCKQIVQYYGESAQLDILCEEAAELIQAVSKVRREAPNADAMLNDGLADLAIMLTQILTCLDDDENLVFNKTINAKLDMQLNIIKDLGK